MHDHRWQGQDESEGSEGDETAQSVSSKRSKPSGTGRTSAMSSDAGDDDDDDDDDNGGGEPTAGANMTGASAPRRALEAMLAEERAINPQMKRSLKMARKAEKKKQRRAAARASLSPSPAAAAAGSDGTGQEYDFARDFYGGKAPAADASQDLSDDDDL